MPNTVLKREEQVAIALRSLYKRYGYAPYKMSKFEAYDLYAKNKDFLPDNGVITFNDTDGNLLALKPDVTLSIIKNGTDDGCKQKVFYNENVYRISGETKQFKELMQVGLECIGDIGVYDVYETVFLALASLAEISDTFILDISHVGVLLGVIEQMGADEKFNRRVLTLVAEKNAHELKELCTQYALAEEDADKLVALTKTYGKPADVLPALKALCVTDTAKTAYAELASVWELLKDTPYADNVRLDFSVVSDMKYYNGILFKGFVDGIFKSVLSGGRYDKLAVRMHRNAGAIGFAVYLDLLESLESASTEYDVDALVLYNEKTPISEVAKQAQGQIAQGKTVRVEKCQGKLRVRSLIDLRREK